MPDVPTIAESGYPGYEATDAAVRRDRRPAHSLFIFADGYHRQPPAEIACQQRHGTDFLTSGVVAELQMWAWPTLSHG